MILLRGTELNKLVGASTKQNKSFKYCFQFDCITNKDLNFKNKKWKNLKFTLTFILVK